MATPVHITKRALAIVQGRDPEFFHHAQRVCGSTGRKLITINDAKADPVKAAARVTCPKCRKAIGLVVPKTTKREIRRAITMGQLEAAASAEYATGKYHPETGGPALARLNAFRHDKRRTKPK